VRSEQLKDITRIVVKLGTGVLTDSRKQPDLAQLEQLVAQVAEQQNWPRNRAGYFGRGWRGYGAPGHAKRPNDLAELQACAAVPVLG
jgi:glutamate 5-kinase